MPTRYTGRRLDAFAAACAAGGDTARALADARRRILAGPPAPAVYPCEIAERADERRQQGEAARPWLGAEAELDAYDQRARGGESRQRRKPERRSGGQGGAGGAGRGSGWRGVEDGGGPRSRAAVPQGAASVKITPGRVARTSSS
ncbi:hypothetical protein [Streptomyces sp. NPDC058613]|uniref:hypothetical protein n=1 Tax=Streptomyces sp. NPDC058613 TaxID=3346556 RepID=UPI00364681D1